MRLPLLIATALLSMPVWAEETPQSALDAFHAALQSGQRNEALARLAPQVLIYESGYTERSREAYASHHLGDDIAFARETQRKRLQQSVSLGEQLAVVTEESETSGSYKGKAVHSFDLETAVLEKQNGRWVITHLHWSSRKAK
ncbi:nuclear transport factor 2 family protein [Massilia sp. TS11]|uniref:YybH family protein n=1 Tax=Massilia sp. TS11 TaxID=2908003 RepID=UPI001EDA22B9|nr:nuclear transport factor 2 family protein [Massilia sp. TS11]MCG2583915.1 nuclear transport factor 2 family protein [Massilia sp. TS11]